MTEDERRYIERKRDDYWKSALGGAIGHREAEQPREAVKRYTTQIRAWANDHWREALGFIRPFQADFGPKEVAAFIRECQQNEVAEAERRWPAKCECLHPTPTHKTPEDEFAWCECKGYVRIQE